MNQEARGFCISNRFISRASAYRLSRDSDRVILVQLNFTRAHMQPLWQRVNFNDGYAGGVIHTAHDRGITRAI